MYLRCLPRAIWHSPQGSTNTVPPTLAARPPCHPPPRVVAIRGFMFLILEQLQAVPALPPASALEPGPSLSQASGSQVRVHGK